MWLGGSLNSQAGLPGFLKRFSLSFQICQSNTSNGPSAGSTEGSGENKNPSGASGPGRFIPKMNRQNSSGEGLKLGSLTDTWKKREQWEKFNNFLANMDEGEDSDGVKMNLDRYARFLELYVRLDHAERVECKDDSELRRLVLAIREHKEDFFGTERCLRCIDSGMRRQVLENLRKVKKNEVKAGTWVYQPVYPRVLDKLNELVGVFNNKQLNMK